MEERMKKEKQTKNGKEIGIFKEESSCSSLSNDWESVIVWQLDEPLDRLAPGW